MYQRSLKGARLSADQLDEFIRLLGGESPSEHKSASVEYFLLATTPPPDQLLALARSEVAKRSMGVQLLLKRYVRDREYQASEALAR